jgi:hypothetical protein
MDHDEPREVAIEAVGKIQFIPTFGKINAQNLP